MNKWEERPSMGKDKYFSKMETENNRPIHYDFAIFDKNNNVVYLIEYNGQ